MKKVIESTKENNKEAKAMNKSLSVYRIYKRILDPSDYVPASVVECSRNFCSEFNETEISDEDFDKVMTALGSLHEREREVIILRFGLRDGISKSLSEVGELFNVTSERAKHIEDKAFRKMRTPRNLCELPALFGFAPPEEPESIDAEMAIDAHTSIEELELSARSYNCLKRFAHIDTVQDILDYPKEDWSKIRNLGRKALEEVIEKMHNAGYADFSIDIPA